MLVSTGPAFFSPQGVVPHACPLGPTWSAVTIPSDGYNGLAHIPGTTKWIATGRGRGGATATKTAISLDGGNTWGAGGTIPNVSTVTPFSLRYAPHNGWLVACGNSVSFCLSRDQGASWSVVNPGIGFTATCVEVGNNSIVFVDASAAFTYVSASGAGVIQNATPAILSRCWWSPTIGKWIGFESAGTRTWTSPDLRTWTLGGAMTRNGNAIKHWCISQKGANICCVFLDPTIHVSMNSFDGGLTWADSATWAGGTSSQQGYSVAHGNGIVLGTLALGSLVLASPDGGLNWILANSNTMVKTWILGYDGANGWLAVGDAGSDDTVANVGVC